ncbi:MAG: autotransporter outer membrane beta-barrel domain-containing protein, partial [Deltaproteobacteria bacterium]|nr:autotransporter outer membrane beta-barrel domain-containing protein [Deltaproteobacteria bacterium]
FIAKETSLGGIPFTPHLNLGIGYEAGDRGLNLDTRFAQQPEVPTFINASNQTGRTRGIVELGADLGVSENVELFIDYRGSFRSSDRVHSATLGMRVTW